VPLSTLVASAATIADATQRILEALQQKLANSLQMSLEDMDPHKPISLYGVDSLIAVEMRNWFVRELKAQVPVFQIVQAKNLSTLAEKVVGKCPLVKASELLNSRRGIAVVGPRDA
jgi:acyl carrier protein